MNLIMQHWQGELPYWAKRCHDSVVKYADKVGAEYLLYDGYPMKRFFPNHIWQHRKPDQVVQKLWFFAEEFDKYEYVLMLDMDMLATEVYENIFGHEGYGRLHLVGMQAANKSKNGRKWPLLYQKGKPMFFGNCLKFNREERVALRNQMYRSSGELLLATSTDQLLPNDEIMLHHLICKSGILEGKENLQLPHARFCDLPEEAHPEATFLHYCGGRKGQIK